MSAVLEVTGLVAGYEPGNPIVRGASVRVPPGALVTLIGPNGAGKSTCVRAIAGLVPIAAGQVSLGDVDLTALPAYRRVEAGLAFVPQSENVFASLSVAENLALGAPRGSRAPGRARAEALLATLPEMAGLWSRPAGSLSGGQRQLLAVARALVAAPPGAGVGRTDGGFVAARGHLAPARVAATGRRGARGVAGGAERARRFHRL